MAVAVDDRRMSGAGTQGLHNLIVTPRGGFDPFRIHAFTKKSIIDEDLDERRRKRRRFSSPDRIGATPSQNEWFHQLQAAADGLSPKPSCAQDSVNLNAFDKMRSRNNRHTKLTKYLKPKTSDQAFETPAEEPLNNSGATTPPGRKMLQVRPDGRLSSPRTQPPDVGLRARKKRTTSKIVIEEKTIVIIKYGIDKRRRASFGKYIQDILSGAAVSPKKRKSPRRSHLAQKEATRPDIPSKPTHPFFLAKDPHPVASAGAEPVHHTTNAESPNGLLKKTSPRKVTSVNKVIKRQSLGNEAPFTDQPIESSLHKVHSLLGTREAPWPPRDMVHVRSPADGLEALASNAPNSPLSHTSRKLKDPSIRIHESEDVLRRYRGLVHDYAVNTGHYALSRSLRAPHRKLMTSVELQNAILHKLSCSPTPTEFTNLPVDEDQIFQHPAIKHLYDRIDTTVTAFDRFQFETSDWVHKYAPRMAEEVLQLGHEVAILRDWLKRLTINAVENSSPSTINASDSLVASSRNGAQPKRKRRKRAEELDGFIISSDEETGQMNEIPPVEQPFLPNRSDHSLKRSVIRANESAQEPPGPDKAANAVVISGPHGCGKTAAVYAIARELKFDVFEINPGSRRSGRDILDKVGDMTRNHLVNHSQREPDKELIDNAGVSQRVTESFQKDLQFGRQGTMNAFFKPVVGTKVKEKSKARGRPPKKETPRKGPRAKPPKSQKQSLILIEEVDVLFEDDKQFWTTILVLILRSRRPVIMTCTDESLIPLNDMALFAILRFSPPPAAYATKYLLLVACNEGHLLSPNAISALYESKNRDLRASITELNLFCQMGIGDAKGGLEWLLIGSKHETQNKDGEKLRVVSDDTYPLGIGWSSGSRLSEGAPSSLDEEIKLLAEAWNSWGVDMAACNDFMPFNCDESNDNSKYDRLKILRNWEQGYEALSIADVCSPFGLRQNETVSLDPTQPDLCEKARINYAEGATLLDAEPLTDQTGTSVLLGLTLRSLARRSMPAYKPLIQSYCTRQLPSLLNKHHRHPLSSFTAMQAVFKPLCSPTTISNFTSPISVLASDVAPYIRVITAYDLRLEEQRRKLDNLVFASQYGKGETRDAKRIRTTRASRAALEGGAKATTRRERWFNKTLDFQAVRRTGGRTWAEIAFNRVQVEEDKDI